MMTDDFKWRLVIGEENECCASVMSCDYEVGSIVYLFNNTLQIVYDYLDKRKVYEVDLDRSCCIDCVEHISHKTWATYPMLVSLASAARRIGKIINVEDDDYFEAWSESNVMECLSR